MPSEGDIPDAAFELLLDLRLFLQETGDRSSKTIRKWYDKAKKRHGSNTAQVAIWLCEADVQVPAGASRAMSTEQSAKPRPDLVLVTVNEHETRAVLEAFLAATGGEGMPVSLDGRLYHNLGTVNGTTIYHAISEMGSGGSGAMQQTVEKAISALDPAAVIAIGIAFGVNEKEQKIGEIIVSKLLRLYELQRVGKGSRIKLRGPRPDASPRLMSHFRGFHQAKWKGIRVRFGVMLTGEKLVDNVDYRDQLVKFETDAEGGVMNDSYISRPTTTRFPDPA